MTRDVLIGVDAGTSVIKSVAFTTDGEQIAVAGRLNVYRTAPDGAAVQDMDRTFDDMVATLRDLAALVPDLPRRVVALAITAQGDGTWLIDRAGRPVGDGWLWLDSRAAEIARQVGARDDYAELYALTATGVNPCNQSSQLAWMKRHDPAVLDAARTAFHCKDWLYFRLTGRRATDPSEGTFTFGDYRTRDYAPDVLRFFGLERHAGLLPPIVDGASHADALDDDVAAAIGLPAGLPVVLGYVDVICTALGGGLYDLEAGAGCSVVGSTGMHMRLATDPSAVRLNADRSGYTMPFPAGRTLAQMQSNMAATLNIDWMLDVACDLLGAEGLARTRADLIATADPRVLAARAGSALYHPYISSAGERGPFMEPAARAGFTGLDPKAGYFALLRAVYEGLALAARDCYAAMGPIPKEIRLTGGAARSRALRAILAAALDAGVRTVKREEAGAAGAAMIAAVQQGLYPDMAACVAQWVTPRLSLAEQPEPDLVRTYDALFPIYRRTREALLPVWQDLAAARRGLSS